MDIKEKRRDYSQLDLSYKEHDEPGREEFGSVLKTIVRASEGDTTIVLDGKWGIGKSHFIQIWMNNSGCRCIYFDAFSADYHPDPFIPLCATLLSAKGSRNSVDLL